MKTKEFIERFEYNDDTLLNNLINFGKLDFIKITDYYDGILSGLVNIIDKTYFAIWIDKEIDYNLPRKYLVLDTTDTKFNSFEELMSKDLIIIGYGYETSTI